MEDRDLGGHLLRGGSVALRGGQEVKTTRPKISAEKLSDVQVLAPLVSAYARVCERSEGRAIEGFAFLSSKQSHKCGLGRVYRDSDRKLLGRLTLCAE